MKLVIGENVYELIKGDDPKFILYQETPYTDFDYKEHGNQGFGSHGSFIYNCIKIDKQYYGFKLLTND